MINNTSEVFHCPKCNNIMRIFMETLVCPSCDSIAIADLKWQKNWIEEHGEEKK